MPDFILALGITAWTMALIFFVASFLSENVTAGDAGRLLARLFAGALFVTGLFLNLLAFGLLRDERDQPDHYVVPIAMGFLIGLLEALLFLEPAGRWLFLPFLLLVFVLRPVRRSISRWLNARRPAIG